MKEKLNKIEQLISKNKIDEAQLELSKLGKEFHRNPEYLYLRSKIFFSNKLYYIAIDTLLIALEFEQNDKFYGRRRDFLRISGKINPPRKIWKRRRYDSYILISK